MGASWQTQISRSDRGSCSRAADIKRVLANRCRRPPTPAHPQQTHSERRVRPLHKSCCLHGQMHSFLKEPILTPTPQTLCPQFKQFRHNRLAYTQAPARRAIAELPLNHTCASVCGNGEAMKVLLPN